MGHAKLNINKQGKLRTESIFIDMDFSEMKMNFQNLGMGAQMVQSFVNAAPKVVSLLSSPVRKLFIFPIQFSDF